jgi:hypothetical protein
VSDAPDEAASADGRHLLREGTRVEVRTGFDRSWANGFTIEAVLDDGYRVRRRSDGEVLPARFSFDDVRRERKNSMWWY